MKKQKKKAAIRKRPGRIVAICTAKGKVIYCERIVKDAGKMRDQLTGEDKR